MNTVDSFSGRYRWLSNFWPAPVILDGQTYPSVEHAYQAAKTHDIEQRQAIARLSTASQAKQAGRRVTMRKDWDTIKVSVMLSLLRQKFHIPLLRTSLLATGTDELVEGNYWGDTFWGVCRGVGRNQLGLLLMQVRSELAREDLERSPA